MRAPSRFALLAALAALPAPPLGAQEPLPSLPDTTRWGVHVLAVARDLRGGIWAGTYGKGIYVLRPGASSWEHLAHDSTPTSIAWDYVHAFGFGRRGQIWYGTIGNGWGLSLDEGRTWRNWTFRDLGPEWQYVAPNGIVTRGDTVWVATADGVLQTTDDGASWLALVDSTGPEARGPADTALAILPNEYVRRISAHRRGLLVNTLRGNVLLNATPEGWTVTPMSFAAFPPANSLLVGGVQLKGTPCGLRRTSDTLPCLPLRYSRATEPPKDLLTTWFRRPIDFADNAFIDQTYRYGSTMGGNFQEHQGVEFNNPDGTPVRAIGSGTVVYAGPAEAGALTVAIRHDSVLVRAGTRYRIYSTYYHNAELRARVGQHVAEGELIARVGNTGRATNDHLHLEIHAGPTDDVRQIVDSTERYPPYTTNPELWLTPLPGTGVVAGLVLDGRGRPVPQARIYGLVKPDPIETPFSFIETYGEHAHSHPAYGEHFAVGDVPPGEYVLGTEIGGRRVLRHVVVEAGKLSWVVFRP